MIITVFQFKALITDQYHGFIFRDRPEVKSIGSVYPFRLSFPEISGYNPDKVYRCSGSVIKVDSLHIFGYGVAHHLNGSYLAVCSYAVVSGDMSFLNQRNSRDWNKSEVGFSADQLFRTHRRMVGFYNGFSIKSSLSQPVNEGIGVGIPDG